MNSVSKKSQISKLRSKVFSMANRLRPIFGCGKKAMRVAWKLVKLHYQHGNKTTVKVEFEKRDGTITERTITSIKTLSFKPNPNKKKRKPSKTLKFVDTAKIGAKRSPIISFALDQIRKVA